MDQPSSPAEDSLPIDARGSQGFLNQPSGPAEQVLGDKIAGDKIAGDKIVTGGGDYIVYNITTTHTKPSVIRLPASSVSPPERPTELTQARRALPLILSLRLLPVLPQVFSVSLCFKHFASDLLWALKDVNFEINRGEVVDILAFIPSIRYRSTHDCH